MKKRILSSLAVLIATCGIASAEPPFGGTIFLDPDIITRADPTTYLSVRYVGRGIRTMFDRRVDRFIQLRAHLLIARFGDAKDVEIQVNPEFTARKARALAAKYARVIGRLPVCLRRDVETVWIHDGLQPFGGGNKNLLIHTQQSALYESDGILEETFVHEAAHTSLDADHATSAGWIAAQNQDGEFISTYARDNPTREDIAESFLPYLMLRYRRERISNELAAQIRETMPARIRYFKSLKLAVGPVE